MGFRPVTFMVQVSTSKPLVREVILIESMSYNVGGEMKLLIWKESFWPLGTVEVKIDEAWTVNAT